MNGQNPKLSLDFYIENMNEWSKPKLEPGFLYKKNLNDI